MTKGQKIVKQLLDDGCKSVETSSKKYHKLSHLNLDRYIYIGKNGAVRYGKNISDSMSLNFSVIQAKIYNGRNKK